MSVVHRPVPVQCSLTPSTPYTFAPIEGGVGQPHQTHPALCFYSFCHSFYSFYHPVARRLPCRRQQPVQRRLLFLPTIFRHFQFPLQQQPLAFEPAQFFLARQQLPWDIHFTLGFVFKHPHPVLGQCMNVVPGTAGLVEYFLQQLFAKYGRFHGIGDNQRGGRSGGRGGGRGGWRRRGIGVGMKGVACSVAVACRTYGVKGGHASIKQCPRGGAMGGRAGGREGRVWFVWFVCLLWFVWWFLSFSFPFLLHGRSSRWVSFSSSPSDGIHNARLVHHVDGHRAQMHFGLDHTHVLLGHVVAQPHTGEREQNREMMTSILDGVRRSQVPVYLCWRIQRSTTYRASFDQYASSLRSCSVSTLLPMLTSDASPPPPPPPPPPPWGSRWCPRARARLRWS